jgi:hypothetical protein
LLIPFLSERFLKHEAICQDRANGLAEEGRITLDGRVASDIKLGDHSAQLFRGDVATTDAGDDFVAFHGGGLLCRSRRRLGGGGSRRSARRGCSRRRARLGAHVQRAASAHHRNEQSDFEAGVLVHGLTF